ncbi:CDP-diacylglycerol--glycerol-3-phosphate 3-phosphatidyltransferase [Kineococcus xinjiangensis]|uniref:CDP-diacylglycerol--glycerol-3-phosphate 3-phosphatidyltransferase n=1 Tax=Kineococcus xinjiangensis TaxID=512762 RepID=A0A2S6IM64_9ACTN|nr:CDP-alcohol phosphatidyltransferase family protein [Kineococcus xinjiangensis]PPK95271.1 CDP-diacylglycerol--glycerol-3-phosphate 3-phosphatidyltransferase [Kineococcus xinjiangensis]
MRRDTFLRRWSQLHGGAAATGLVRWWLGGVHALASPLAGAGVAPAVLTLLGLAAAVSAVAAGAAGGGWLAGAAALVVLAGVLDSLDGAVAVLSERTSRAGAVLDAVCDRLGDAACAVLLWVLGAPALLLLVGAGSSQVQEYARARAQAEGVREVGVVSVCERPVRLALAAAAPAAVLARPDLREPLLLAAAGAWALLGVVALGQVLVALRRGLRGAGS